MDHPELTLQVGQWVTLRASKQFLNQDSQVVANQRTLSAPEVGSVRFRAGGRDDCVLMHDGQAVRSPPFTLEGVAAGNRVFEFKCGDAGIKLSKSVTVVAGEETPVIVR